MKYLFPVLFALAMLSSACASARPPAQQITINCPSDSTCDPTVTPPPYTSAQIQAHAAAHDMDDEILMALMIQDMSWRQCYGCYSSYYDRYPSMYGRVSYIQNLPSNQRATYVQTNNTTVIQKNTTIIQQVAAKDPPALKTQPAPATTSGNSAGTGGGNAATNKAPPPAAPVQQAPKPAAPAPPPPAPAQRAPAPPPPPAPAPKR